MKDLREKGADVETASGSRPDRVWGADAGDLWEQGGYILYAGRRARPLHGMRYAVTALVLLGAVGGASFLLRFIAANQPHSASGKIARAMDRLPKITLWAWERPEDLSFIDPKEI